MISRLGINAAAQYSMDSLWNSLQNNSGTSAMAGTSASAAPNSGVSIPSNASAPPRANPTSGAQKTGDADCKT